MIELLPNTALKYTTPSLLAGDIATGYDVSDAAYGPRSKMVRLQASASLRRIGYASATPFDPDYIIIAGAHKMLTAATSKLSSIERNEAGTWLDGNRPINLNPLTSASLIGPKSQDVIKAYGASSKEYYGFGCDFTSLSGSQATEFSKMYISEAFDFGAELKKSAAQYKPVRDKDREFFPMRGYFPYDTQAIIQVKMSGVTSAKILAFDQLVETDRLLERAFFLYDANAYFLKDKLYHVVLVTYKKRIENWGYWGIELEFRVLRYYD